MFTNYMIAQGQHLSRLARQGEKFPGAYNSEGYAWKNEWHRVGRSVLTALAKELKLDVYKVSNIRSGVAVAGETTLTGVWLSEPEEAGRKFFVDGIYLDTASPAMGMYRANDGWPQFMWRTVRIREPLTVEITPKNVYSCVLQGTNQWASYALFNDLDNLVAHLRRYVDVPVIN